MIIDFYDIYDSEVFEWLSFFDVFESGGKIFEFEVDGLFGGFSVFYSFNFEGINGFELMVDIVGGGFESSEVFFDFVDDSLVF